MCLLLAGLYCVLTLAHASMTKLKLTMPGFKCFDLISASSSQALSASPATAHAPKIVLKQTYIPGTKENA